jgi:high-affinity K+ transport system ATPase subunit B
LTVRPCRRLKILARIEWRFALRVTGRLWVPAIILPAIGESFIKLNPVTLARNPVIFVTEVGAAISTISLVTGRDANFRFQLQIAFWLWFIVLIANFAEAMAEGRGKVQAKALRGTQTHTFGRRLKLDGTIEIIPARRLRKDDVVVVSAGELIPDSDRPCLKEVENSRIQEAATRRETWDIGRAGEIF